MKRLLALVAVAVVLISMSLVQCRRMGQVERRAEFHMGTLCEMTLIDASRERRDRAFRDAFALMTALERDLSIFNEASAVSRINREAFQHPVAVPPDVADVIRASVHYYTVLNGAFDITTLPLSQLWGFKKGTMHVPSDDAIARVRAAVGSDKLVVNETENGMTIWFKEKGMGIDLGGIAKGYAVDRMVALVRERGIRRALVNVGGNMFGYGLSEKGRPWTVGVRDPRRPHTIRVRCVLDNMAIATSGDYEQFFMYEGKRYTHIFDPRTGRPIQQVMSATIRAPRAMEADALSKIIVLGPDKGLALVRTIPEVDAYLVYDDAGTIREARTGNFQ